MELYRHCPTYFLMAGWLLYFYLPLKCLVYINYHSSLFFLTCQSTESRPVFCSICFSKVNLKQNAAMLQFCLRNALPLITYLITPVSLTHPASYSVGMAGGGARGCISLQVKRSPREREHHVHPGS